MDPVRRARRSLLLFATFLIPLTGLVDAALVLRWLALPRATLVLVLMWVPALAALLARLAGREGFADVTLRLSGRAGGRALALAILFPLAVGLLAYGAAWATGLATFQAPDEDVAFALPLWMVPLSGPPAWRFLQSLALHLTIGALSGALFAAGEELGWRGHLLPRLVEARVPMAVPLSGLAWAAWHWPLVLGSQAPHRLVSLALFTLLLLPLGALLARWRLETGSLLPAIVFHALWNELLGFVFGGFTVDEGIWLGESGLLVVGVAGALAIPLLRGRRPVAAVPEAAAGPG